MGDLIICETCGGLPKSRSAYEHHITLKKHLDKIGGKYESPQFRCESCGKNYHSKRALEIHMLTDQHKRWAENGRPLKKIRGEKKGRSLGTVLPKNIECEHCDKKFATEYHLRRHKVIHGISYCKKL